MKLIAASVSLLIAVSAHAGDTDDALRENAPRGITETFFACANRADTDLAAQSGCVSEEKKVQDARLNKAYLALMKNLEADKRADMKAAERSWIDFNDRSYRVELAIHGVDKTADIETATSELYRYCERANELQKLAFFVGD